MMKSSQMLFKSDNNKIHSSQSRNRFKGKCSICGVWGHQEEQVMKERIDYETDDKESLYEEMLMLINKSEELDSDDDEDDSEDDSDHNSLFRSDDESEASYVFESMDAATEYMKYCGKDVNEIAAAGVSTSIDTMQRTTRRLCLILR